VSNRNYDCEFQDSEGRKYAYDFDYLMHGYLMRTFAPHLSGSKALELGCYKGEFTAAILQRFDHVTVVEGSAELANEARARVGGRVNFMCSTFEQVELPENTYDAVFLIHTLEHLDNPVAVLNRIKQWLAPTGKLFVAVPNANAISRQIAVKMGTVDYNNAITQGEYDHGHRKTYTLDALEFEVRKSGLQIMESGGVFFKPFANFQFDRMLKHDVVNEAYMEGCFQLGKKYPDFCASIYTVCDKI
jgi:2-polyprenyl-3-methyl-5-hydroxy-6-metoxy-1,4-benzoquinol methylase